MVRPRFSRLAILGARMRAVQITHLSGPESALELVDLAEPEPSHVLTPGEGVVVEVHAAGVSFPEVLQTRGEYQISPPLPFVPGSEVGGVVRRAPDGGRLSEGDRVAAFCMLGGFAETAVAPEFLTFPLHEEIDFAQGAGLILNYHTAFFALVTRGRLGFHPIGVAVTATKDRRLCRASRMDREASGGDEHAASAGIGATIVVTLAGILGPWRTFAEFGMAFGSVT